MSSRSKEFPAIVQALDTYHSYPSREARRYLRKQNMYIFINSKAGVLNLPLRRTTLLPTVLANGLLDALNEL